MDVETSELTPSPGESDLDPVQQRPDSSKLMVPGEIKWSDVRSGFRDRLSSRDGMFDFKERQSSPRAELQRPERSNIMAPREIIVSGVHSGGLRVRLNSISSTISCESFRSDRSKDEPMEFKRRDPLSRWQIVSDVLSGVFQRKTRIRKDQNLRK